MARPATQSPTCISRVRWQSTRTQPPGRPKRYGRIALGVAALGGIAFYSLTESSSKETLNGTTFVPYQITSREAISPDSFVLTVSPRTPNTALPYLNPGTSDWSFPLWSVEFKQPQVQIARHYTPLPPQEGEDPRDGTLRFYIRSVGDGEMSNYLGRLRPGEEVWLRGPHQGLDIMKRLGSQKFVTFVAGGTGVAPGLQAAHAVLGRCDDTHVKILWSVRKREELQAAKPPVRSMWEKWTSNPSPTQMSRDIESPSPLGRQLQAMKARYGDRLMVLVSVDEERTSFSRRQITESTTLPSDHSLLPSPDDASCQLHNQTLHRKISEFEDRVPPCSCNSAGTAGQNLLVVSGPDGFISHFAGQKIWLGGLHTQGSVGGIVSQVFLSNPQLEKNWLVLKL